MDIEYLREFVEVVRDGNFTRAACALGISRPALSKHISAIEREFGVQILERDHLHTALTPAGEMFYQGIQPVLADWDAVSTTMRNYRAATPLHLKVGIYEGYKPMEDLVGAASERLQADGQHIEVELVDISRPIFSMVRDGSVDVCSPIFPSPDTMEGLASTTLYDEPLVAVVAASDMLATHEALQAADLTDCIVWTMGDGTSCNMYARSIERVLLDHGARPRFTQTPYSDWHQHVLALSRVSYGVYVTLASIARYSLPLASPRYRVLPFSDDTMRVTVCNVWRSDDANPAITAFNQAMADVCRATNMSAYWR